MGRYRNPKDWFPRELLFFINLDSFKGGDKPSIVIGLDGKAKLQKHFLKYSVTVVIEQEDADVIDITDAQYATMQRIIDFAVYNNPGVVVYFTEYAGLWGKSVKNFDGMDFNEAMEASFAYP